MSKHVFSIKGSVFISINCVSLYNLLNKKKIRLYFDYMPFNNIRRYCTPKLSCARGPFKIINTIRVCHSICSWSHHLAVSWTYVTETEEVYIPLVPHCSHEWNLILDLTIFVENHNYILYGGDRNNNTRVYCIYPCCMQREFSTVLDSYLYMF